MTYDPGDSVTVTTTVTDPAGVATDATMALAVTKPDGTAATPSAISHDGTGKYSATVTADQPGVWLYTWTASGALVAVDQSQFTVAALGPRIVSLAEVKLHLNKTSTADDNELRGFVDSACDTVRGIVGPVVPETVTDTYDGGSPRVVLRTRPVLSVTSVVEAWPGTSYTLTPESDPPGASGYAYSLNRRLGILTRRSSGLITSFQPGADNITVTYLAGRAQPWPAAIRMATLELTAHLWRNSQLGRGGGRPQLGGEDTMGMVGLGYAVPHRVQELLRQYAITRTAVG